MLCDEAIYNFVFVGGGFHLCQKPCERAFGHGECHPKRDVAGGVHGEAMNQPEFDDAEAQFRVFDLIQGRQDSGRIGGLTVGRDPSRIFERDVGTEVRGLQAPGSDDAGNAHDHDADCDQQKGE